MSRELAVPPGQFVCGTRDELAALVGIERAAHAQAVPGIPGQYVIRIRSATSLLPAVAAPPPRGPRLRLDPAALASLDRTQLTVALLGLFGVIGVVAVVVVAVVGMVTTAITGMVLAALPALLGVAAVVVIGAIVYLSKVKR